MRPGILELLVILIIVLLFFGKGKVSSLMEELGKGLSAFKKGASEGKVEEIKPATKTKKPVAKKKATTKKK